MARKILGNDPFTRGSAIRPAIPELKKGDAVQQTPEVQVPKARAKKTGGPERKTPAEALKVMAAELKAKGGPGKVKANAKSAPVFKKTPHAAVGPEPMAHADAPEGRELKSGPVAHGSAPEALALERGPVAHGSAPEALELKRGPVAHGSAPSATELKGTPIAHADVPELMSATNANEETDYSPARAGGGILDLLRDGLGGLPRAISSALGAGAGRVDVWGRDAKLTRGLKPLADLMFERYWRVSVEGAHSVPVGACLLAANHSGALPIDGPLLHLALRRYRTELKDAPWLLEDQIFNAPVIGLFANRLGAVRANPENAFRLLKEQRPVIVFPEGMAGAQKPFSKRHELQRFGRGGAVKIALSAKVPIVPVAIVGGEETSPLLAQIPAGLLGGIALPITTLPLPARWHIRFGEPIFLDDAPVNAHDDAAWVAKTNDELRDTIQSMVTEIVSRRTGVF